MNPVHHELILGGQKSGKTARAETLAAAWLARGPGHRALYLATAMPWDEEMRRRIARHQQDRARRVPGMATLQAGEDGRPLDVPALLRTHGAADTAIVLDCLTLWLTQQLSEAPNAARLRGGEGGEETAQDMRAAEDDLVRAVAACPGPVYVVSNEIGLGVIPLGAEVRAFVDALGRLNQRMAVACSHVTLMAAGLPLALKAPTGL